jgi:serine protease Do
LRNQIGAPEDLAGAVVTNVDPGSPAAEAGLQPGDVILEMNREPVESAADAARRSRELDDARVLLRVWSQGGAAFVILEAGDEAAG